MLISMDILAYELRDFVSNTALQQDTGLTIGSCRLLDGWSTDLKSDCVYIACDAGMTLDCSGFPSESNFIALEGTEFTGEGSDSVNVIYISGLLPYQAANMVLAVFDKYDALDTRLRDAFADQEHLQTIVDIVTEMIGCSVCMLEMNHCLLAASTTLEPVGDSLWDAMKTGYGYEHYSIIDVSQPKLHEMDDAGLDIWEDRSNISGRYIRVYMLRRNGRGVASLGLHKLSNVGRPFEKHIVQLADWAVDRISSKLEMFSEVKVSRGMLSETFLADLVDGKEFTEDEIKDFMETLSIKDTASYYLGFVLFKKQQDCTEYDFALMDYIETILSGCQCFEYDGRVLFLLPLGEDYQENPNPVLEHDIPHFLDIHGCYGFVSSAFESLTDIRDVYQIMLDTIPFMMHTAREEKAIRIYRYYEFALMHAIGIYEKAVPLKFAENEQLAKVIAYDKKNKTDYYATLEAYLKNSGNITATAEDLFIHRNSLSYRLQKIEGIIGCSLDDQKFRQNMLFSVMCHDYGEQVGEGK